MLISLERNEIDEKSKRTNYQGYVSTCESVIEIFFKNYLGGISSRELWLSILIDANLVKMHEREIVISNFQTKNTLLIYLASSVEKTDLYISQLHRTNYFGISICSTLGSIRIEDHFYFDEIPPR